MHIISGELKGRTLKQPKDKNVRPTRELVRKAVFDVLGEFILDKEVLDLFSGSGAFGFEALSCGAKSVTFVEKNFLCQKVIKENMDLCGVQDRCALIERDVFQSLPLLEKRKQLFGIVFADPPYSGELAKKSLLEISKYDILHPLSVVVIEYFKKDELPLVSGRLNLWQIKKYGDTFVSFYILERFL